MTTFIESSNCRGRRPEGVVARRHFSRPDIIARLLRDRRVVRFIVAPSGFGKSTVAFEYADIIFSFEHVFWLNGRSPCFLRDLDAGRLSRSIVRLDPSVALVVCDDVPRLDAERTAAFTAFVDDLLDAGAEVIATCVPSADSFTSCCRDRVLLEGADLLLSDDEMAIDDANGRANEACRESAAPPERIACLRWVEGSGPQVLLQGVRAEELPGEVRLSMLAMLLFEEGALDDLSLFVPAEHVAEIAGIVQGGYAFFGVDIRTSTYRAARIAVEELSASLCPRIDDLVPASVHATREALCGALADALLVRGKGDRACSFMMGFAPKSVAAAWALSHGWQLLGSLRALPLFLLIESAKRGSTGLHEPLCVLRAWAALQLDDGPDAAKLARRALRTGPSSDGGRAYAALALLRSGKADAREQALSHLEGLLTVEGGGERAGQKDRVPPGAPDWRVLAKVALASREGAQAGLEEWDGQRCRLEASSHGAESCDEAAHLSLLLCAAWMLEDALPGVCAPWGSPGGPAARPDGSCAADHEALWRVEAVVAFVRAALQRCFARGDMGWCAVLAGSVAERAAEALPHVGGRALAPAVASMLHRREVALFEQREAYRRHRTATEQGRLEFQLTHPDVFRKEDAPCASQSLATHTSVPTLEITMFGGLEARIGGVIVNPRMLSRQKTKTLLALLAIYRGREVSKERLSAMLWPESDSDLAKKNFYTVWSQLRRALKVGDSCPYLLRTQCGCQLDARLVSSDVQSFEALCRALIFGTADADDWERLYFQVCNEYAEDFMPGENENAEIISLRLRYRMQAVDALITASKRLCEADEPRGALWFAREALRRDAKREDAYVALMRAQIASDQRGAALETYFSCRKFLSEELGIDPSLSLVGLYRSIIEVEERFS